MATSRQAPLGHPAVDGPVGIGEHGTPASVLGKAWLILEAFAHGPSTIGLSELSRRSGVPKASVHRLADELTGLGLLVRSAQGYQLGWRMFELGQRVPRPQRIQSAARPVLAELRSVTRGIAHLTIPQGADCVYLEGFAGRNEAGMIEVVGARLPKYMTASGRVFLAYADPQSWVTLDGKALTALGVHQHSELDQHFAVIRDHRYSQEHEEIRRGFKTLAVPVLPYLSAEQVVAGISITMRADRRDEQQVLHALWAAAADISRSLPYSGPGRQTAWSVLTS